MKTKHLYPARAIWFILSLITAVFFSSCEDEDKGLPDPPIKITRRKSFWFNGDILIMRNTSSSESIVCDCKVETNDGGDSRYFKVSLAPGEKKEVSYDEINWLFQNGQIITVKTKGYARKDLRLINEI